MFPDRGPFFYQCKKCGKSFISSKKKISLSDIIKLQNNIESLAIKIKCPECGSKKIKSKDWIINKYKIGLIKK